MCVSPARPRPLTHTKSGWAGLSLGPAATPAPGSLHPKELCGLWQALALERVAARQQLVQQAAQRPDVAAQGQAAVCVHVCVCVCLRGNVGGCASVVCVALRVCACLCMRVCVCLSIYVIRPLLQKQELGELNWASIQTALFHPLRSRNGGAVSCEIHR